MMRPNRRLIQIPAGLLALLAVQGARASDIPCNAPLGGPAARCEEPYGSGVGCEARPHAGARKGHLICEYTMLSQRYERIYGEQQKMLRNGTMQAADIAAWRARRDACDSVRCLDGVFHQFWRQRDAMPKKPAVARQGATENPLAARHEAASRPLPPPAKPASRGTPASAPAPATSANVASAAADASIAPYASIAPDAYIAPDASVASGRAVTHPVSIAHRTSAATALDLVPDANATAVPVSMVSPQPGAKRGPEPLLMESLLSGLAVLGLGAGVVWKRRRAVPRAGQGVKPRRMPAVMKITYGLLLVNALLLPFTLGLR
ncbi:hypothetical protein LMG31506_03611 [Cupriavidus yeoncheonensis]|uniref:Uncharacterized protein n=2 Tax=Cupriavidus yeoncheonensis TaxID=1462994 RepID=A0A916IVX5_9BURK|nr:hypothetical protein LMG31506_03611 [Cupriavidus yeoncheonensis]